jgi:hypothetical protein
MLMTFAGEQSDNEYNDDKIHSINVMGDMFKAITQEVKRNDLKSFRAFLESDKTNIKDYVTDIINDQLIDVTNNDDFEQSIEKVNQYIKKVKTRNIKNRIISGDENAINEFTKSKQD